MRKKGPSFSLSENRRRKPSPTGRAGCVSRKGASPHSGGAFLCGPLARFGSSGCEGPVLARLGCPLELDRVSTCKFRGLSKFCRFSAVGIQRGIHAVAEEGMQFLREEGRADKLASFQKILAVPLPHPLSPSPSLGASGEVGEGKTQEKLRKRYVRRRGPLVLSYAYA